MTNQQPYTAALFDLDGTLIDSTQAIVISTMAAIDELNWPPVSRQVIIDHIGYKLEAIFPDRTVDERKGLIDTIGRHYDGICADQTRLYPGVHDLLNSLSARNIPMGVVTSKRRGHTETILSALEIRHHFRVMVCSDDVARMKPDPEGVHAALSTLSATADRCLYVGDTVVDVQTARNAGVAVAGVAWGTDGPEKLARHGLDHAIDTMAALLPLFRP